MLIMSIYKIGQFAKLVRRTPATIRRWEAEGKITSKRLPSGHRYFDDSDLRAVMGVKAEHRVTVVYCRVSSKGQKPDLDRQLESMQMWAVGSGTVVDEWITEIGGGMNFKRPKFLALIDRICRGEISRLIVAHKDRLVRFGFELIRHGSVRISVSGEVIPGAAQRGCPLYLRCSMPDLMR